MSKKQKVESTPASENFVSVASPQVVTSGNIAPAEAPSHNLSTNTPNLHFSPQEGMTFTPNLNFSPQEGMTLGLPGTDAVSGTGTLPTTQACWLPHISYPTSPYIGDALPDYNKKWVPALPGDQPWTLPSPPWVDRSVPNGTLAPREFWGVQKVTTFTSDNYYVLPPLQVSLGASNLVAYTKTEKQARLIADVLNEKAHPPKKAHIPEYSFGTHTSKLGRLLTSLYVKNMLKNLIGRVLTVIDASVPAEAQNNAMKSILKQEFRRSLTDVHNAAYREDDPAEEAADEDLS